VTKGSRVTLSGLAKASFAIVLVVVIIVAAIGAATVYVNTGQPSATKGTSSRESTTFSSTPKPSNSSTTELSKVVTTETLPSFHLTQTKTASANSTLGLSLVLSAAPSNDSVGQLAISAEVDNIRNTSNDVTSDNNWPYSPESLNPWNSCGAPGKVGFGIFQGNYDLKNFSSATALRLYNLNNLFSCTVFTFVNTTLSYSFQPHSDILDWINSSSIPVYNENVSISSEGGGFWNGQMGNATYHNFPAGTYTIIGADEWGQVVFLPFTVVSVAQTITSTVSSTNTTPNWDPAKVANATLNSAQAQSYIHNAYSYDVAVKADPFSPTDVANVFINVTGTQIVVGNYTSGYTVIYGNIVVLNATVQYIAPDIYDVVGVGPSTLPNQTQTISFSPQQQQVIRVALANTTVQKLMGGASYYQQNVTQVPLQNGTFAGDYFVFMYQLNGTRTIGVYVNPAVTAVVGVYNDTRSAWFCFGSTPDFCYWSPWK
jgi:hypothetical protein